MLFTSELLCKVVPSKITFSKFISDNLFDKKV